MPINSDLKSPVLVVSAMPQSTDEKQASSFAVRAGFNIQIAKSAIEMGIPEIVEKPPGSPHELRARAKKGGT